MSAPLTHADVLERSRLVRRRSNVEWLRRRMQLTAIRLGFEPFAGRVICDTGDCAGPYKRRRGWQRYCSLACGERHRYRPQRGNA